MILKSQTLCLSANFKNKDKTIVITKNDVTALNQRIRQEKEVNERERLSGLSSASAQKTNKGIEIEI